MLSSWLFTGLLLFGLGLKLRSGLGLRDESGSVEVRNSCRGCGDVLEVGFSPSSQFVVLQELVLAGVGVAVEVELRESSIAESGLPVLGRGVVVVVAKAPGDEGYFRNDFELDDKGGLDTRDFAGVGKELLEVWGFLLLLFAVFSSR